MRMKTALSKGNVLVLEVDDCPGLLLCLALAIRGERHKVKHEKTNRPGRQRIHLGDLDPIEILQARERVAVESNRLIAV